MRRPVCSRTSSIPQSPAATAETSPRTRAGSISATAAGIPRSYTDVHTASGISTGISKASLPRTARPLVNYIAVRDAV